ncbi:hypothetical protein IED13_24465 [Bosea sp. SSUT16]|uniref:Uncharacterized protein n=1 Tax=Bosea spartocytisi TaxID=2773451 RepID=A0A927I1V6_9HYPH|nr:hypothetical protein [Bosea spartocytisi]
MRAKSIVQSIHHRSGAWLIVRHVAHYR